MQKAIVVGKGKTAKFIKKQDYQNDILVGINQAALFLDYPDFVFANDIEGLDGISEEKFLNIKNLAIPEYPHYKLGPHLNIKYDVILPKCKNNLIIYNIWSCPQKTDNFPYIDHDVVSSGDTAIAFLAKFYNIKNFELYGIANEPEYHQNVIDNLPSNLKNFSKNWNSSNVSRVKSSLEKLKVSYNLNIQIN